MKNRNINHNNKIWIDNIESLFYSFDICPNKENSKEENFNNISRLLMVSFLFYYLSLNKKDIKKNKHFEIIGIFLVCMFLLIFFYFNLTKKEYFKELNYLSSINNNSFTKMDTPPVYKYPLMQNSKAMEKMNPTPIIYPRSHDKDIWSFPSYKHSAVNDNSMGFNISDEYEPLDYNDNFDPRVNTYRDDYGLLNLNQYCNNQNGNVVKTSVNNTQQIEDVNDIMDFQSKKGQNFTSLQKIKNSNTQKNTPLNIQRQNDNSSVTDWRIKLDNPSQTPISTIQERYDLNPEQKKILNYIPLRGNDNMSERRSEITLANNENISGYLPNEIIDQMINRDQTRVLQQNFIKNQAVNKYETDPSKLPPQNLLIPKTQSSIYGPGMVNVPERTKYMQNIQPNIYSFSDTAEPINANIGISYNPDLPPRIVDQVEMSDGAYPLYHRIDPQLVREGGIPKERLNELPRRTKWSAKYNTYDAMDGSVNFEDIYDPRFTGYGDEYRSYVDVNLGNVQYYYSDIDAYRDPNFGTRSKVDFIDFVDPMGRIKPEYSREVGLNDVKATVQNQYDADSIYFREDLMERLMRKRNQELWQLRAAPLRKDAHSNFSSGM